MGQPLDTTWMMMVTPDQKDLWRQAWLLLDAEKEIEKERFADYGYIVFPAGKVYEGFLKSYFYQMGMIDKGAYLSEHFRIGKALNPDLPDRFRDQAWVFDDVSRVCSEAVARQLWNAWKICRNQVFHYNGNGGSQGLNLLEAEERLRILESAMKAALRCEAEVKRG